MFKVVKWFGLFLLIPGFTNVHTAQTSPCAATDYPCQIEHYSGVIKRNPKNIEAYYHLGFAYQRTRQRDRAMEMYRVYLASSSRDRPNLANGYNNRGILYRIAGQPGRALDDLNRALNLDPHNARFLSNRGNVYRDLSRYNEAIADYRNALVTDPDFAPAFLGRGLAYGSKGDPDRAINDLTRAIEIGTHPDGLYNRGVMYSRKKDYASAHADYTRYIEMDSQFKTSLADSYLNRGIANYYLDDREAALKDVSKAIELNRDLENAYRVRSMLYRELKKDSLADADEAVAARLARKN